MRSEFAAAVELREYRAADRAFLELCMEEMQDHLAALDPLRRLRRLPTYARVRADRLLEEVARKSGIMVVAEVGGEPAALAVGVVEPQTDEQALECVPTRAGVLLELIVREPHRRRGIGSRLLRAVEERFRARGCTLLWLEVFAPNEGARAFYRRHGFHDRLAHLGKPLDPGA